MNWLRKAWHRAWVGYYQAAIDNLIDTGRAHTTDFREAFQLRNYHRQEVENLNRKATRA